MLTNPSKTHIEQFWNYLDELSEKNPDEYKKFVGNQLKKGMKEIENNVENQNKSFSVEKFISLRFRVTEILKEKKDNKDIKVIEDNSNAIHDVPKIVFMFEFTNVPKEIKEEPKIYLNIVVSKDFSKPYDRNNKELSEKECDNLDNWAYIPTEFRANGNKLSMRGLKCYFYDVLVSEIVARKSKESEELKKSILAYIVRKFDLFIKDKFKLYLKNVKILKNHKYKSIKMSPETFVLNKYIDNENIPTSKNFKEVHNVKIPEKSENFPGTSEFYNLYSNNAKTGKGKENKKVQEVPKKIKIEEIKQKLKIPLTKEIIDKSTMLIKFDFKEFKDVQKENIDLQISNNELTITLENIDEDYEPVYLAFDFEVNPTQCKGEFNSQYKYLKVFLSKQL